MEEDTGRRDLRVFQACAPSGKLWGGELCALRIDWATGKRPDALAFNEAIYQDTAQQLAAMPLQDMTPEQREEYATD